jgi:hypothetical protein
MTMKAGVDEGVDLALSRGAACDRFTQAGSGRPSALPRQVARGGLKRATAGPLIVLAFLLALPCTALAQATARIVVQHAPLAGFVYYDGKAVWSRMKVGDPLTLVREPQNAYDANAVRLEWRGHMLGYVPRRDNADLARQMDHGAPVEAHITELTRHTNGRHRVSYEIYVPLR